MNVMNMTSSNGNSVPNQFIIEDGDNLYFQSYKTIIAKISKDHVFLDKDYWDYSTTTGKYRNMFLNEGIAITRKKIKSGEYTLTNLN